MEVVKRSWAQIAALLSGLNRAERAVIILGAALILVVLIGFVMWSGQSDMVRLTGIPVGSSSSVAQVLERNDITYELKGDKIYVKSSQYVDAYAYLNASELMTVDVSAAFTDYLDRQNAWTTNEQVKRQYRIALQRVLGASIAKSEGIDSATVILGMPEKTGFGRTYTKPTASVSVSLEGKRSKLSKSQVESIANTVAFSIAELEPQDVAISDDNGRPYRVGRDDEVDAGEVYALHLRKEDDLRDKIFSVLSHIPGVRVEVSIKTDNIASMDTNRYKYDKDPLTRKEETESMTRENVAQGGAPGVTSNTGMSIAGSQGAGTKETRDTSKTEDGERPITEVSHLKKSAPDVLNVSATVLVPRSFFVEIWKRNNPESKDEPTDTDLQPLKTQRCDAIAQNITPLLNVEQPDVRVDWLDDTMVLAAATADSGVGGVVGKVAEMGMMKHAGSIVLGIIAVGLMLWMVRSATKPEKLPTVEELAGIPPELPSEEDFVGEVDEQEATMAGYELDEGELQSRRIAEQISDLIKNNPNEAANIFGKWARTDD